VYLYSLPHVQVEYLELFIRFPHDMFVLSCRLREIPPSLMGQLIESPDLFVMQTEFSIYVLLRWVKWIRVDQLIFLRTTTFTTDFHKWFEYRTSHQILISISMRNFWQCYGSSLIWSAVSRSESALGLRIRIQIQMGENGQTKEKNYKILQLFGHQIPGSGSALKPVRDPKHMVLG